MITSYEPNTVAGLDIDITVISGRDLVAKDKNLITRKKTTSDPYVRIYLNNQCYGTTKCVKKTLNPTWNQKFKIRIPGKDAEKILQDCQNGSVDHKVMFWILDHDDLSDDDNMGIAYASLLDPFHRSTSTSSMTNMGRSTTWYSVQNGAEGTPMYSKNATGDIQVKMHTRIQKVLNVVKGNSQSISGGTIQVCLNWSKQDGERGTDLDTSCVGIDSHGNILMDETAYYDDLINSNGSIRHSGDQVLGGGKDEVITCNLDRIPRHVRALYFLLTAVTPGRTLADVKSASVEVVNAGSGLIMCRFTPSLLGGENTAMFLMRIERMPETFGLWKMKIIDESDKTARDFGTLIPEIKGYSRDLVPGIIIDPKERIAVMRKGGTIRVLDYCRSDTIPSHLTFGLAWDVTNGVNIDLDASAICLDSSFNVVDILYFGKLRSDDNSIVHHGDEREGDEIGDDEKISIYLQRTRSDVAYIVFVINSYSGQELDDISKASCHLFDPVTNIDIAKCSLSNNKSFDKRTAIVMSYLYRESNDWFLRVINEPGNAKVANELVPRVKRILQDNPSPLPASVPDPEIIVTAMPDDVDITVDAVDSHVPEKESVSGQNQGSAALFVPSVPDSASNSHSPFVPPSV